MKKQEMAMMVSREYRMTDDTELYYVYGSFSRAKVNAWENCKKVCREYEGKGLRILSHNPWQFTAGFLFTDKETGKKKIAKITKSGVSVYDYI